METNKEKGFEKPGSSKNDEDDKKPPDPPDDSLMLRPGHGAMSLSPGQISPLSEQEQIDNYTARYPIPGMPHEKRDMVLPLRPLSERPSRVRNLMSFMDLTATNAELDKLTVEELAKRPTPSKLITARIEKNPRFFQSCMPTRPDEMKQRLDCHEMPEADDDPDRRSPPPIDAVPTKPCIRNEERKPAEERSVQFNYVKVTRYYIDNYDPIFKVARRWRRERGRDITFADSMAPSMRHLYLQVADYHTDLIYPTVIDRIDTSDRGMVASGFGMHYASPPNTCAFVHTSQPNEDCGPPHTSEPEQWPGFRTARSPETSGPPQISAARDDNAPVHHGIAVAQDGNAAAQDIQDDNAAANDDDVPVDAAPALDGRASVDNAAVHGNKAPVDDDDDPADDDKAAADDSNAAVHDDKVAVVDDDDAPAGTAPAPDEKSQVDENDNYVDAPPDDDNAAVHDNKAPVDDNDNYVDAPPDDDNVPVHDNKAPVDDKDNYVDAPPDDDNAAVHDNKAPVDDNDNYVDAPPDDDNVPVHDNKAPVDDNDNYVDAPAEKENDEDGPDNDDEDFTDAIEPKVNEDDNHCDFPKKCTKSKVKEEKAGHLSRRRRFIRSLRSAAIRVGRLFTSCCTGCRS